MGGAPGESQQTRGASFTKEAVMTGGTEYLSAAEIAELTGMSLRTVRRWINKEVLPSTKLGGARLVARADLECLLFSPPTQAAESEESAEEHD
jgi:excisionase family DNA binding protein